MFWLSNKIFFLQNMSAFSTFLNGVGLKPSRLNQKLNNRNSVCTLDICFGDKVLWKSHGYLGINKLFIKRYKFILIMPSLETVSHFSYAPLTKCNITRKKYDIFILRLTA